MTSIVRRLPGVSASTAGSMARPMNGPASAASRNPWRLCPRPLPGNALPAKSGIRRLGWLLLLRWRVVRLAFFPSTRRKRGPGPGAAGDALGVVGGPTRCGVGQAPPLPDACRAPGPLSGALAPAASRRAQIVPLGHLRPAPEVQTRQLSEYDQLCGLEVLACSS